jgi:hypothetical protein
MSRPISRPPGGRFRLVRAYPKQYCNHSNLRGYKAAVSTSVPTRRTNKKEAIADGPQPARINFNLSGKRRTRHREQNAGRAAAALAASNVCSGIATGIATHLSPNTSGTLSRVSWTAAVRIMCSRIFTAHSYRYPERCPGPGQCPESASTAALLGFSPVQLCHRFDCVADGGYRVI